MKRLSPQTLSPVAPYAVAIAIPLLVSLSWFLSVNVIKTIPVTFFTMGVLFSAWYGGLKPGMVCGVVSTLLIDYFIFEPRFTVLGDPTRFPVLLSFLFLAFLISAVEESRLRTEKELRQSRDQLQIVLQGINDGVTAQTPDGQPLFANESSARITGFASVAEMLALPIAQSRQRYEMLDENNQPITYTDLPRNKVVSEGVSNQKTFQFRFLKSGERRWVTIKSSPVFDARGIVQMVINIFSDITDDKEIEVKLRNAHERLQTMLASINNGVVATDTEGRIELMNPLAETLTGWTRTQAVGKPFEDIITLLSEKPGELIISPIRTALRDKRELNVSGPTSLINKDGVEVPVGYNAAPIKDQFGSVVGAVMVFRDISDRQKAERERNQLTLLLAAQQRRLENILANIPGIVWESVVVSGSQEQRLEFVNAYAEKILGYTREEWLSVPNFGQKIIHPDDVSTSQKEANDLFEAGNMSATIQFRCIAKNGRIVPIEAHYTILTDDAGKVIGTCGLMMDISQRKADEIALQQSALDLKRSNEQLEQFAYVASHDLQEPLRMVTSYLQLLERRYKDNLDQDANEFIAFAVDGASRMKALINDLLAYSRVKTTEQDFVRFEMTSALKQAMTNLQMSISEANVQITHDALPSIIGNEGQCVQLFQNLLSNAIKFQREIPPKINISAVRSGKMWTFSVQDNGIGIEPQYVDRIFVIFQRLHTKDRYPGTGIGLAICKKVVEHHGGRIWAESIPGTGTNFQFTIPVR